MRQYHHSHSLKTSIFRQQKNKAMRQFLKFICYAFLSLCVESVHSQPYYFKKFQVEQGLSNNNVTCCIQDSQGFIWFGTREGLNRFDGYSFHIFRNDPEKTGSIGNNWIRGLAINKHGILWVGTDRGLYKYNQDKEDFSLVSFTQNMRVSYLVVNSQNDLWLLIDGKLVKYNEQLDYYKAYDVPDNSPISSLCLTPQGLLWVSTTNGMIHSFDESLGIFTNFNVFKHSPDINSKAITNIYASTTTSKLFIGTMTHGVKIFDTLSGEYRDLFRFDKNLTEITVKSFLQISPDEVWIGTESGLFIYYFSTDNYIQIKKVPHDPYSISANAIQGFCQDQEGGIWIGTLFGGINYYTPFQPFTKHYPYPNDNTLIGDVVHDICMDSYNNLWIATEDAGINCKNLRTGKYENYQPQPDKRSLTHTNIHGLIVDKDKLWIGTYAHGIDVMDIPSRQFIKHYSVGQGPNSLKSNIIVNMKKTQKGQILVATSKGLFTYDTIIDQFVFSPQFPSEYRIQCISEGHDGTIWAGYVYGGAYFYNPQENKTGSIRLDTLLNSERNTINDIYEDNNQDLWFATMDGIIKYNRKDSSIIQYNIKKGMPSNVTFRILPDGNGKLWISTTNGLACLNPQTEEINIYTKHNGLITNQFNYNSGFKADNGDMYFGMVNGFISFDPIDIKSLERNAKVYLTGLSYYDESTQNYMIDNSVTFNKKITLKHNQSTFTINFSALSYVTPETTQFAFCMKGLEESWTYLQDGNHTAYFTKLSPGNYLFKVKANVSGAWSKDTTDLRIEIMPPWWFSVGAFILYISILILLGLGSFQYVSKRNREKATLQLQELKNEKEKELYQAKIDFFINIAHEIRTPLTLIKSPLEKVTQDVMLPRSAKSYLDIVDRNANRLLELINQLLDFRKTEIEGYKLNFVPTDIIALIYEIYQRFHDTAEQQSLQMTIEENIKSFYIFIDKEACTKIISNLLSNAIKYAKSKITINYHIQENTHFNIDITNDGCTISNEIRSKIFEPFFRDESSLHKSGTGLGLPLARSLAEMHEGSLTLEDSNSGLIVFRLCLPINQPNSLKLETEDEEEHLSDIPEKHYIYKESQPSILIVEDNSDMGNFIAQEINVHYNVITARNGEEALSHLKESSVQLIISDIMMPVMDGFTLLKKIKTDLEFSHIPIILLTAKNTLQSRMEGLELGADAYMDKPFSMDLLLTQATNLLNNRNNMRTYYFNSPLSSIKSMAYTKADERFLKKLNDIINEHIDNVDLDVEMIADRMSLSRPTLYRKISGLSNLTPNELIKISRLKKAAELILQGNLRIYEIAEAVGFNSQSYFSRAFSKQFNMSPSQYAKENNVELK